MSTNYKERLSFLKEKQKLPLDVKIAITEEMIKNLIKVHSRLAVAWSGGKDSTVLLYLVQKFLPNIDVIWVNTGIEFPECVKFVKELKQAWNINLYIAKPKITFWQVVDKFGWPMLGKGSNGSYISRANYLERKGKVKLAKATRDAQISAACCRLLKEKPSEEILRSLGVDCVMVGNLVADSRQRFLIWAQKGEYYYNKKEKRWKAWPLAFWTEEDIWQFHELFNIPCSEIYKKGHRRNGCWPCLMDIRFADNKLKALRLSHPKLWKFLIVKKGLGKRLIALKVALHKEQPQNEQIIDNYVNTLVELRPCFFDHL